MSSAPAKMNPFPGLRPFTQEEDYLFFGREEQTLELLQRLGSNRFVAVVGTSGSGKSSLVRCGLLSELLGGRMLGAGASWEIAVTHPGGNPLSLLTDALLDADLYDREEEHARENLLATLSRSQFGLVEAVKQADPGDGTNFLLVVDQFEEIFRFHETGQWQQEAANEFVSLLLEAASQKEVPIYVVLTMRSDFIGECGQFEGLAEMVNRGEFLIPRLTREQYKRVIEGPIKVGGGQIEPRLLQRLLNDLGQQADQLPCLQHALMRTWDVWAAKGDTEALDLDDYQRVGKMSQALSLHADEIYESLAGDRQRELCRGMFQALTVEESNSRGIRRPQRLGRLRQILEVSADELLPVIDAYRHSGATFLMPSPDVGLTDQTIIDISHESLMRVWTRLRQWVEEETQAAGIYHRLSESAALHERGKAGLYRDPELGIALAWRESKRPNAAWAERYRPGFVTAMGFLEASRQASVADEQAREAARQHELESAGQLAETQARVARQFKRFAGGLAVGLCLAVALTIWAFMLRQEAIRQETAANSYAGEANTQAKLASDNAKEADVARRAVEQTLADSYTATGIQASELNKSAESLIWFAAASRRSVDDPVRERDNAIRFWSWARNQPIPVRALKIGDQARALTFHPAGRYSIGRNSLGAYLLWDLTNERPDVFPDGNASVSAAAWNREGSRLATCARGGRVSIWRFPQGERLAEFELTGVVSALAFDESGKRLAVASDRLRVWDCEDGKFVTPAYAHPRNVAEIVFSQSGERVATTCADGMCRVWPVPGDDNQKTPSFPPVPHPLYSEDGWGGYPSAPVFLNGDRALLTRGGKNARAVWIDTTTGATVRTIGPNNNYLGWMVASPDRAYFAVASFSVIQLYDAANGNPVGAAMSHGNYAFTGSFHPDGKSLLTVSADRTARLWSVPDGKPLSSPIQHQDEVVAGTFLPRGSFFATAQKDGMMRIWKHESLARLLPTAGTEGYCQIAPDGRHVIAAGFNAVRTMNSSRVFDLATGQPAGPTLDVGGGLVNNAAFAPKGKHVVLLASLPENGKQFGPGLKLREQAGRVHFFDWSDGRRIIEPLATPSEPIGAAFSPDGKRLVVVCAGGEILLLDPATGRTERQSNHGAQYVPAFFIRDFVRFFADGSRFVTWGLGNEARVWDAESGQLAYAIAHTSSTFTFVFDARFSPDGKLLATASHDKTVAIVDAATGRAMAPPLRHSDWVFSLRFSPDGKHIATACRDRMARIWDWQAGKLACPTLAHENEVFDVCYTCDGRFVLTAGKDGITRVWDAALGKPMSPPLPAQVVCYRVAVMPDNLHVVVAGSMPSLLVYRLADLVEPGASPRGGLQDLAEVISGLSLHPGGGIANLTTAEWLERWTSFRDRNPTYPPLAYTEQAPAKQRFPAMLRGEGKPADNAERLAFAKLAYDQKKFAAAARLLAEALASDPKLGDDRLTQPRYQAARAAALAAAGQGKDEPPLDDATKAKLRGQALDWLKAELTVWDKLLASDPPQSRPLIVQTLSHWQKDPDLTSIRDAAALAKLPADEQKAFTQLWADVAAQLNKAEGKPNPGPPPATKPAETKPELAPPPREKK